MNQIVRIKEDDFTIVKQLGSGGFGNVYLATHKHWGDVAVKVLRNVEEETIKEAEKMWKAISSEFIVRIKGIVDDPDNFSIVMEYFEYGSLKSFRKYLNCDCWSRMMRMITDIAMGMNYLHTLDSPILHRDLKVENVFVGEGFRSTIGDLGLAISAASIQSQPSADTAGTCSHIPPELWAGLITKPNKRVDVYGFAITLYEFVTGKEPWPQMTWANAGLISLWVKNGNRPDLKEIPDSTPKEITELMKMCWVQDPEDRPSFEAIQEIVGELYRSRYKSGIHDADQAIHQQMKLKKSVEDSMSAAESLDSGFWGSSAHQDSKKGQTSSEEIWQTAATNIGLDRGQMDDKLATVAEDTTAAKSSKSEKDKNTRVNRHLKREMTTGGSPTTIHSFRRNIAVCMHANVAVYDTSAEGAVKPEYTLTSPDWTEEELPCDVTTSDRDILVVAKRSRFIYLFPQTQSAKESRKISMLGTLQMLNPNTKLEPFCITSSASKVVVGALVSGNMELLVFKAPDITKLQTIDIEKSTRSLDIEPNFLLCNCKTHLEVRAENDLKTVSSKITIPSGWECRDAFFDFRAKNNPIFALCWHWGRSEGCVYRYQWDDSGKEYKSEGEVVIDCITPRPAIGCMAKDPTATGQLLVSSESEKKIKLFSYSL